jgi:hypothetical protein
MSIFVFDLGFRQSNPVSPNSRESAGFRAFRLAGYLLESGLLLLFLLFLVFIAFAPLALYKVDDTPGPDSASNASPPTMPGFVIPAAIATALLLGLGIVLGVLSTLVLVLRKLKNQLYWQVACWLLVVTGILVRPFVISSAPISANLPGVFAAGVVGLVTLPGLMRWLNRINQTPGLSHVAVPLSLGFFLDIGQLATLHFLPAISWLPRP